MHFKMETYSTNEMLGVIMKSSQLTCSRGGFIAQSVEHRPGLAEVMGLNPVEASDFFSGLSLYLNCLSYFTTAKITFTSILYLQFTHMIFII